MKLFKSLIVPSLCASTLFGASLNIQGGDVIGKNIYGVITNYKGNPILLDKTAIIKKDSSYSGFINIKDEDTTQDFILSSFMSDKGIGSLYLTKTKLENNNITAIDTQTIDLSPIGGVYAPSKGIKTPWNTYIFTQDKLVDGKNDRAFLDDFAPYFEYKKNLIDSYNYGWSFEAVVLNPQGDAKVLNQYAMGRTFASDIVIMPDNKTVYLFDGKYSKNLYMFISQKKEDFMSGILYVADGQSGTLVWKELSNQSALKIKLKLRRDLEFKTLYKSHEPKNDSCKKGYSFINTIYGKECLQINKRSKKDVGVFEPLRQAALLGVKSSFEEIDSISYAGEQNMILFYKKGSVVQRYSANNKKFDSEYIIK